MQVFQQRRPKSLRVATLLDKPDRRQRPVQKGEHGQEGQPGDAQDDGRDEQGAQRDLDAVEEAEAKLRVIKNWERELEDRTAREVTLYRLASAPRQDERG